MSGGDAASASGPERGRSLPARVTALSRLSGWRRWLAAWIAGLASAGAMPPVDAVPVLFATLPALVLLLDGAAAAPTRSRRIQMAAAVGWWFGFGYFLAGLWWIGSAFLVDADTFAWMLPFAVAGLPAGLALFPALGTTIAILLWRPGAARILALAVGLAACEWLRGHVLTGFPWNGLGYALAAHAWTMQSAAIVGVYGLAFLAVLIFAAPAAFFGRAGITPRSGMMASAAALVLLAGIAIFGAVRLDRAGPVAYAEPEQAIRVVQPSIDQALKWNPDFRDQVFDSYLDLSRRPWGGGGELPEGLLVIWPESAIPFFLTDASAAAEAIGAGLPTGGRLLTGAARYERTGPDATRTDFYNSILQVVPDGEVSVVYDKVHLVPFGEYLPFQETFESLGLEQLTQLPGGFSPGRDQGPVGLPGVPPFSAQICYEIIFPGAVIDPGQRPHWLLNLTNDAWFGRTPGPYQHLRQARIRAVEEGLPLVRAANTGISVVVDPFGRILERLDLGATGTIDTRLPASTAATVYARLGDGPALVVLVLAAVGLVSVNLRRFGHD
ncbi:apolipoprotein N-acyltransferase [Amorphus orientalis]|uniref:Apolipoprotein N-acyltransferase n=1 Tax=Amorphus orientalis TaxID=649198 RepID=A0AAE4AU68_9HYPH|nr:apolipoprotein N-acyltransferase [Amorphus orientalis]MDQ0317025.1 apolipoprotein N-acyltransferase [Amorphus orientalis]